MLAGKLGRNAPHPRDAHPRVSLEDHVDLSSLPPAPHVVDRASKVLNWPMYMNNQLGDCTEAAKGHIMQAISAYGQGVTMTVSDNQVIGWYERDGGYTGDPSTDRGCVIQDVLKNWHDDDSGIFPISAYTEILDCKNPWKLKQALYLFGAVYLGINCAQSAIDQFNAGLPWKYDPSSPIRGGHAVTLQQMVPAGTREGIMGVVTWGKLQPMTLDFARNYIEEAWIILTPEWIQSNGADVDGFSTETLLADFSEMRG